MESRYKVIAIERMKKNKQLLQNTIQIDSKISNIYIVMRVNL